MQDIIQMCSFEGNKSTKGASKMRRDLINTEISQLRDLLPLPASTRQRLSQLQLMALVCVYLRKSNYFQHLLQAHEKNCDTPSIGFSKALNGFPMMMTQGGKLLFISENAAEYLGHSMEDLLIHGDSVYDIIDKQDHTSVQSELIRGTQNGSAPTEDTRYFLCRMNVSRNARRQLRFGDQKVVLVKGRYLSYLPLCSRNEPVFLAHCTPLAMPETRESVVQGATNVFTSVHTLDLKILNIDKNGEFYLGYNAKNLIGVSWYHLVHPDYMKDVQSKHKLITTSEQDRACIMLLRLQSSDGSWQWIHCVLQVKDSADSASANPSASPSPQTQPASPEQSQQPVIVATNQILNEKEAHVLKANSWLYQLYAMQSKLQYGINYEAHTQRVHPYYPQAVPFQNEHFANSNLTPAPTTTAQPTRSSAYTLPAGSPYLQHYHHPYSVRLHSGFDYYKDTAWSHYNTSTTEYPYHHYYQTSTPSQLFSGCNSFQHKSAKRPKTSPRRSPFTPPTTNGSNNSNNFVVTPLAVKATSSSQASPNTDIEEVDNLSWKSSPTQEVPDSYDYSYVTPPYITTPTKANTFNFEAMDTIKNTLIKDHRLVPNLESIEQRWETFNTLRSPWLPPEEITGPLRVLSNLSS